MVVDVTSVTVSGWRGDTISLAVLDIEDSKNRIIYISLSTLTSSSLYHHRLILLPHTPR